MHIYITNILTENTEKSACCFGLQNSGIILPVYSKVTSIVHATCVVVPLPVMFFTGRMTFTYPSTVKHPFPSHTFNLIIKIAVVNMVLSQYIVLVLFEVGHIFLSVLQNITRNSFMPNQFAAWAYIPKDGVLRPAVNCSLISHGLK